MSVQSLLLLLLLLQSRTRSLVMIRRVGLFAKHRAQRPFKPVRSSQIAIVLVLAIVLVAVVQVREPCQPKSPSDVAVGTFIDFLHRGNT